MIRIENIEVLAHIGVSENERSRLQRLTVSVAFWPNRAGPDLNDDIARAVNYAEICAEVRRLVQDRRDRLIETLADALTAHLLGMFKIKRIVVEVRKYILPEVEFVSVTITRERPGK